ncbi:MAG TPA: hypothetical protein VGK19_06540 [Capsulimonadaceae bacterium]|jgi:ribosomal protein L29
MAEKKKADLIKEMRKLDDAGLNAVVDNARKAIYEIRRARLSAPETNVRATRTEKKQIARALTIKRQREIAGNQG